MAARNTARRWPRCSQRLTWYAIDGGEASTGSFFRKRRTSSPSPRAVSYRLLGSFSSPFITIQSNSSRN